MNKAELVNFVADKARITTPQAENAYSAFLEGITLSLKKDKEMKLDRFGTFIIKERKTRPYTDPKTGEPIKPTPTNHVFFRENSALKRAVNYLLDP